MPMVEVSSADGAGGGGETDARSPVAADVDALVAAVVVDDGCGAGGTRVEAARRSPTDVSAAAATRAARTPTRTARDASAASFRLAGRLPWWPSDTGPAGAAVSGGAPLTHTHTAVTVAPAPAPELYEGDIFKTGIGKLHV